MCLTIYLGADQAQELVSWDPKHPGFNVSVLRTWQRKLVRRLDKPFLYEIGAHTGCGCGFLRDEDEDQRKERSSIAALVSYLAAAAAPGPVELLVCWIGDETKEAVSLSLSAAAIEDLDLSTTWERPVRVSVQAS